MSKSNAIKFLLFLTALTPIVYTSSLIFPFVFGKVIFFRVIIEIALILFSWHLVKGLKNGSFSFQHPIVIFTALFTLSVTLSTIFATDSYRAFWGDVERGGGLFGILHFLVFFLLTIYFFTPKDWLRFFKISVIVGAIVSFYGWLQYIGISKFPFALPPASGNPLEGQPGSFLGNPAYLSAYLILLIGISFILAMRAEERVWRRGAWVSAVFFFLTIFITQIRGAILGVGIGILFFLVFLLFAKLPPGVRSGFIKRAAAAALLLCALGTILFWVTRNETFWQSIPGVRRLARESFDISSVSTRLIALGVSWDAFLEKPVFGWGPENYNIAYNKHYNPAYSYYAEDWFDRAHNKVAGVSVTQGAVGILSYLALFITGFYFLFKRLGGSFWLKPLLASALVGYFIQNLFLFDTPVSYLFFFSIFSFLTIETKRDTPISLRRATAAIFGGIFIIGALAGLYFGNFIPLGQAKEYIRAVRTQAGDKIFAASDTFLYPHSFAQSTIRDQFSDLVYDNGLLRVQEFRPLADKVMISLEELVEREPYEPRHFIRLVENYTEYAKDDHSYFAKTEEYSRRAYELSPERQGVRYHLAFTLAARGKYGEAIKVAEGTVSLDPRVYKSQYQLGIIYSLYADARDNIGTLLQGEYRRKALEQFTLAWEMARNQNRYAFFLLQDFNNLISIYRILEDNVNAAEVLKIALREHPNEKKFYIDAMAVYRDLREKEKLIEAAKKLGRLFPETKSDTEVIINLTENEKWDILDTL